MWAIKWFLAVLIILIVLGFALQNTHEVANVVFVTGVWEYQGVQLWMVIYASFALGVLFWLVVSIFQVMQLKNEIRRVRRSNHEMQHELDSLRNLPISEDDTNFEIKDET
jgi:uncharacterized integral membrane protein